MLVSLRSHAKAPRQSTLPRLAPTPAPMLNSAAWTVLPASRAKVAKANQGDRQRRGVLPARESAKDMEISSSRDEAGDRGAVPPPRGKRKPRGKTATGDAFSKIADEA